MFKLLSYIVLYCTKGLLFEIKPLWNFQADFRSLWGGNTGVVSQSWHVFSLMLTHLGYLEYLGGGVLFVPGNLWERAVLISSLASVADPGLHLVLAQPLVVSSVELCFFPWLEINFHEKVLCSRN